MTDIIIEAWRRLLAKKAWGRVCEEAIKSRAWDDGILVQNELAALLRDRREAEGD